MTTVRSRGALCQLTAVCLLAFVVTSCRSDASEVYSGKNPHIERPTNSPHVAEEGMLYAAALDTLFAERRMLWSNSDGGGVSVVSTLLWWPMEDLDGTWGARLGPISVALPAMAARRGLQVTLVPHGDVVGHYRGGSDEAPVVVFGPVDYFDADRAVVRANIYLGPNGQELYRVLLHRTPGAWRATNVHVELQS